jgi:hypothetical protein
MPFIQGRHNGRAAYVEVAIVDAARYQEHKQSQEPVLTGVRPFRALIDTGATSTMITRSVVRTLGLQPATKVLYRNKDGLIWTAAYLFHAVFYPPLPSADNVRTVSRTFVFKRVITGGEIEDQPSFDVLLGMDVITSGKLTISSDGTFRFEF